MDHIYTEDELVEFRKELLKYKQIGAKQVLSILRRMQSCEVTIPLLKSTKIAQTITSLSQIDAFTSEENSQIKSISDGIIKKWKKLLADSKSEATKSATQAPKRKPEPPVSTTISSNGSNIANTSSEDSLLNENLEGIPDYNELPRRLALKAILKLFEKVRSQMGAKTEEWVKLAVDLEETIFCREENLDHYRSNVKEVVGMFSSNEIIIEVTSKLFSKDLPMEDVATAKSDAFLTDKNLAEIERQKFERLSANDPEFYNNIRKNRLSGQEGEVCKACKKKTAFLVKELQTRSSDEPMTRFMECNNCGKAWRD